MTRGYDRFPFPPRRRAVVDAMKAGRAMTPVHGLIEVDVTEVRRRLRSSEPPLSFTGYVVACVARAVADHPDVHVYRDWFGRLVRHHHVDVVALIEVPTEHGPFPLAHVVHGAEARSVASITDELHGVRADPRRSETGRALSRWALPLARIPGFFRLMYRVAGRSIRLRRRMGTVSVTSVGMFGGGGGHGIGFPTLLSVSVLVGGISTKPWVVEGRVDVREIVDLTVTVDHNVVDGAPAARFGSTLRRLIETGEVLD